MWLGACHCDFPQCMIRAAAAEMDAEQAAQLAEGETLLHYTYDPTVDELVTVGIQRLQNNKTWKLWMWPPAAKEFLTAEEFK